MLICYNFGRCGIIYLFRIKKREKICIKTKIKIYLPPPCSFKKPAFINKQGFTLAEVLITLVIIGVIAAITVPTLITKYQKEQTVTRLKKAYSALSQTAVRAIADNGPMSTWEVGESNSEDAKKFLNKYMIPYLSIMKEPTTYTEGNWDRYYSYLNNQQTAYGTSHVRFYLNDGTSITAHISHSPDETSVRLMLYVDINGDKKPNKVGRDIFFLDYYIKNNNSSYIGRVQKQERS